VTIIAATEPATEASWWSLLRRGMVAKDASTVGDLPADDVERWYVATGAR
jgi:hypothetical protein